MHRTVQFSFICSDVNGPLAYKRWSMWRQRVFLAMSNSVSVSVSSSWRCSFCSCFWVLRSANYNGLSYLTTSSSRSIVSTCMYLIRSHTLQVDGYHRRAALMTRSARNHLWCLLSFAANYTTDTQYTFTAITQQRFRLHLATRLLPHSGLVSTFLHCNMKLSYVLFDRHLFVL